MRQSLSILGLFVALAASAWLHSNAAASARQQKFDAARVIATLDTGSRPEPIIADASHHRVYIGNESAARITVLNDRTNRVLKIIPTGHEVEDLALDPSTGYVYSANRTSSSVSVVDTAKLRLIDTIRPGARRPASRSIRSGTGCT